MLLYKRKKEEKSGLTSLAAAAEALLELSEFSFFPSAQRAWEEELRRRGRRGGGGYRENVYTARDPS